MDEELLSDTFVELTDTMVVGFDVIDFLHVLTDRSVQLLDVSAAGLLLADPRGELRVVAASSEAARLLELFQIQNDQGPCLDCFRSGQPVTAADLAVAAQRWPRFAPAARQAGFAAVQALPMRLREQVIGALNLFRVGPGAFAPADIRVGQALADVATISLLHERSMRHSDTLTEQLQAALNSRVIIEQAKGKLAERLGLDMDQAFNLLRDRARTSNRRLSDLAQAFVNGTETVTGPATSRSRQPLPPSGTATWSGFAAGSGSALGCLQAADESVEAKGEALLAVVGPGVGAVCGQGGEAAGRQGAEECVQLLPGRAVAQSLLGGRGGVGEGEAQSVVIDEAEGQGGLAAGQAGRMQRCEECLGQGQGCGADGGTGLEQDGDAGVALQDRPQSVRERGDLCGPGQSRVGPAVDLGKHSVEDKVIELFLAADVAVQRPGNHAEAAAEGAHAEGLRAICADDREGLGDDPLAGERAAAAVPVVWRVEPERARVCVFGWLTCHACLRPSHIDCERCSP